MYRLIIVSGPNRGSSFTLVEGENTIGRQNDNHIVLTSSKVSKVHCSISVSGDSIRLFDETSTNGTFINGALMKKHTLKPGDKLGVGDFVLELVRVGASNVVGINQNAIIPSIALDQENPNQFNGNLALAMPKPRPVPMHARKPSVDPGVEAPKDPVGLLAFLFEGKIMPAFYGNLMKTEFKAMVSILIAALVLISVVGSVMPTLDIADKAIQTEAITRAKTIAREVADRFLPAIASRATSQIDLSVLENDENVRMAAIVNLDMQIIAPQSRLNQVLAGGAEASFAMMMAKRFNAGDERPYAVLGGDSLAIAIEPLKVIDPRQVKSQIAGMVIISIDFSRNMIQTGGMGIAYGIALVIAGLAGFLVYLILIRLTFKPFEVMNDDLDQVLRGELPKVTHEFKIQELNNLWDNINAAAVRGAKSAGNSFGENSTDVNWDYELVAVRALAEANRCAFIAFDSGNTVVGLNEQLDEVMGIRMEALGQSLQQIARDQAFVALVQDLKERSSIAQTRAAFEETEFSGVAYHVTGMAVGPIMNSGIALVLRKRD